MNAISLKRIKLLLLADWYELKEYFLWIFLAVSGVFLAIMLRADGFTMTDNSLTMVLSFLLLLVFIFGMNYVSFRSNSVKGLGFLTPARPIEKLLAQAIVLLIFLLSGILVYFLTTGLYLLIEGKEGSNSIPNAFWSFCLRDYIAWPFLLLMLIQWLGCLSFKKKAIFKSVLIIAVIVYAATVLSPDFIEYLIEKNGVNYEGPDLSFYSENIYPGVLGLIQFQVFLLIPIVLTMLYIGYLKLKEKEQR